MQSVLTVQFVLIIQSVLTIQFILNSQFFLTLQPCLTEPLGTAAQSERQQRLPVGTGVTEIVISRIRAAPVPIAVCDNSSPKRSE